MGFSNDSINREWDESESSTVICFILLALPQHRTMQLERGRETPPMKENAEVTSPGYPISFGANVSVAFAVIPGDFVLHREGSWEKRRHLSLQHAMTRARCVLGQLARETFEQFALHGDCDVRQLKEMGRVVRSSQSPSKIHKAIWARLRAIYSFSTNDVILLGTLSILRLPWNHRIDPLARTTHQEARTYVQDVPDLYFHLGLPSHEVLQHAIMQMRRVLPVRPRPLQRIPLDDPRVERMWQ